MPETEGPFTNVPGFTTPIPRAVLDGQAYYTCSKCWVLVHWRCRRYHKDWHEEVENEH